MEEEEEEEEEGGGRGGAWAEAEEEWEEGGEQGEEGGEWGRMRHYKNFQYLRGLLPSQKMIQPSQKSFCEGKRPRQNLLRKCRVTRNW